MTGLRLAALAAGPGHAPAAWRLRGDQPPAADYLSDEVLAALLAGTRLFLERGRVTAVTCGDLADAITGGDGGAALFDQLSRENAMVTVITGDDVTSPPAAAAWYRVHPLLRDLLHWRLRRERPAEAAALAARAARWLAAHGMAADAVRTASSAGDWDLAAEMLGLAGPVLLLPAPGARTEAALAASALRAGNWIAAGSHLDDAERAAARRGPGRRPEMAPWLLALRVLHA